ncbi:MAG: carbohydrate kinase family protein [Fimbriimonadaceae bacterium]|nr:MAG: carbohydrate kinase family protein [Fimbriimonadaceae bacterium]
MILVFGTICLDRIHRVPRLPKPGGYVEISESTTGLGGEAANTAFALQKWKATFKLIGNSLGTGITSELIYSYLKNCHLQHAVTPKMANPSPICEIMVTPDGQRTMFGLGFANLDHFSDPNLVKDLAASWLTVDPNLGDSSIVAAKNARDLGAKIYWMDFPVPKSKNALPYQPGDVWQSSTDQFGESQNVAKNIEFISQFHEQTGALVILSDGKYGFYACGASLPARHFQPFHVTPQIDSTGAGDCFRAGMIYSLDLNKSLSDCFAFAAAAGSLACRGLGATATIPTLDEIHQLLAEQTKTLATYD